MDISFLNEKDSIDNFLILDNKHRWGRLAFMLYTDAGANNIFWEVDQNHIADMHHQSHVYFGLKVIVNVGNQVLTNPLVV